MRIAMVVDWFPVLSETFVQNQIKGLVNLGHEVDIFARVLNPQAKTHSEVISCSMLERTVVWPRYPQTRRQQLQSYFHLFSEGLKAPGQLLQVVRADYGSLWDRLSTRFMMLSGKPSYDIIHCQFGTLAKTGQIFRGVNGGKLVVTFRGYDISKYVQQKGKSVYDPVFQSGDLFLTNCEFFQRRLLNMGCPAERLQIHYSGLNSHDFPFRERGLPEDGHVQIAMVGRLVEKKGTWYAIEAVTQVAELYPNLTFKIAGDGPLRESLQRLIDTTGMTGSIQLIGSQDRDEIIQLLNQSHVFIAPSVTAQDGDQDAPINVLKEAMALGLPVISTHHGGIPELVQEGISGFLVPERDSQSLADRLHYLIRHPDLWPAMGRAGRAFVEQVFDLTTLNQDLVRLYQWVLAN